MLCVLRVIQISIMAHVLLHYPYNLLHLVVAPNDILHDVTITMNERFRLHFHTQKLLGTKLFFKCMCKILLTNNGSEAPLFYLEPRNIFTRENTINCIFVSTIKYMLIATQVDMDPPYKVLLFPQSFTQVFYLPLVLLSLTR